MANLYDITERYKNILDLSENEEVDFELFREALDAISDEFENKADNIVFILKDLEATAKAIKEEELRLLKRRKALENNANSLKMSLENMMRLSNKTKFKTTLNSFSISKSKPSVVIENEELIPSEYKVFEEVCKIDKNAIYTAFKNGENIEGVSLKENESLRIK